MQVQMQVFGRKSGSLRKLITQDLRASKRSTLRVEESHRQNRKPGWAKITATDCMGAINIEWDANHHMLTARAIAKKKNSPMPLLGKLISYLMDKHGTRISSINIQLR